MLDGEENVTFTDNAEIRGLSDGVHKITFYAFDNSSKLETSKTVTFSVKHQPSTPKPRPTRVEAINYFASLGYTKQKVSDVAVEIYKGVPVIKKDAVAVGLEGVAFYAQILNTTVINEFEYDFHWKFFFLESEVSKCRFYACVYD